MPSTLARVVTLRKPRGRSEPGVGLRERLSLAPPMKRTDPRVQLGMSVAFLVISITGMIVFFKASDPEVGGLFIGLACVYVCEFLASLKPDVPGIGTLGERLLGFFHIGTGIYLMYLMFAVATDFAIKWTLKV
jgi:hypothetical protein